MYAKLSYKEWPCTFQGISWQARYILLKKKKKRDPVHFSAFCSRQETTS